ncbi:hypothetical protein [Leptolyngbya sp. NIES-2104]|uniref:hypothetical protein n=1 Tax=Leptolyngbya sp. NIES-2104 TaxID=1552121 RepID=UPI0006EC858B|nr:hypothetical protein [Leptolyngbya sp. NIES-2104]GAQ00117.1 hypothetical protein NIES2104_66820 [Leptolyngbya sp. NIES-2104]
MSKRERITLRLDAEVDSIEGYLIKYLKHDPAITSREAILRALKAFYLLWALENCYDKDNLKFLAKTLLEELHFRMLQIHQRFLEDEAPITFLPLTANSSAGSSELPRSQPASTLSRSSGTFSELIQQLNCEELELDEF